MLTLGKGLVQRGHSVHVMTSGGDCEESFLSHKIRLQNVDIKTKSELSLKIYSNLLGLKRYILSNQIDIIHSQTRITQVMGRILKVMTGRNYVSTCHGFFKTRLSRKFIPCWGDRVIAISDSVYNHLVEDFNVSADRIDLIPNGIALNAFSIATQETKLKKRKEYGWGNEPIVGIIARLSDVKGQDLLVSAFKKVVSVCPEAKLLLVGEGKLEPMLKHLVKNLQLQKNVVFISQINKPSEILQLLDVFVMPSRQEGLGLSVMEAQATGLPVIASKVGGLPSLIEHGRTGFLVNPRSIEQLAEAIIDLLSHREKARQMGILAYKMAEKKYSSHLMVDRTVEMYKKVVSSRT